MTNSERFKNEENVFNEIARLEAIYKNNGSVIASYDYEFTDQIIDMFESVNFDFEYKEVDGMFYSVVSKSDG